MIKMRVSVLVFVLCAVLQGCEGGVSVDPDYKAPGSEASQAIAGKAARGTFSVTLKKLEVRRVSNAAPVDVEVVGISAENLSRY